MEGKSDGLMQSFVYPAPWGEVFHENAFRGAVGRDIKLRIGSKITKAHVHEALVIDDGRAVEVTMEVEGATAADFGITHDMDNYSFVEVDNGG
jgi:hypothetical protein